MADDDRRKTFFLISSKLGLKVLPAGVPGESDGRLAAPDDGESGDRFLPAADCVDPEDSAGGAVFDVEAFPPNKRETPPNN
ncbi:MAG: hypothetical protein ACUVTW_13165 [Thermogutta sp.]